MKKRMILLFLCILFSGLMMFHGHQPLAASKSYLMIKGKKKAIGKRTVGVYVGEKNLKLAYSVNGKTKGIKGKWTSSDSDVIKVNKKGVCVAHGNGKATVRFTYKSGKKKKILSCNIKAMTRAKEVELTDGATGANDFTLKPGEVRKIGVNLIPKDEALKIDETITVTDNVYYELFGDENLKSTTDLGRVDRNGIVYAGEFGGTMYLRAKAKPTAKSKYVTYSNVLTITIDGLTKEEKAAEEERLKKEAKEATEKEKTRPARIEISDQAPLLDHRMDKNGLLYANLYFRLYDGNGKEITYNSEVLQSNFNVTWNGQQISVQGNGVAIVTIVANIPGRTQGIGTTGEVVVKYKESTGKEITALKNVRISPAAFITSAEVKGIYRAILDPVTNQVKYEAVLEADAVRIKKGDKISDFGGHSVLNTIPGSYYLLIKAVDNYNNFISNAGMDETKLRVDIVGKTKIEIEKSTDFYGKTVLQSIKPVFVDGMTYLTYPLKAAEVDSGELQIILSGGYVRNTFNKMILDGTSMNYFFLTGQAIATGGTAAVPIVVGRENVLEYYVYNSKGESVKDYDQILSYFGLSDPAKTGIIHLPPDSNILSSAKNSFFRIRKNKFNNQAEILYFPQMTLLLTNNPRVPVGENGQDVITVLRGFGKNLEKTITLIVNKN